MKIFFDRLFREKVTIEQMIRLYCNKIHNTNGQLCKGCTELFNYALQRVDNCPFSDEKPVCNKCPIHCYKKEMREKVRTVMRFSGPKMLFHHPILAILHIMDKGRKVPEMKSKIKESKAVSKFN